ncbi:MAG TPA: hypothetical protein VGH98_13775 [Gemmatimonadaceae bacterium]|jgi:hypothetical protein
MTKQNYTDEERRHWTVTFEVAGLDGQTVGRMIFRSGTAERIAPCREIVWNNIAQGTMSPFDLEDTLEAHFRVAT